MAYHREEITKDISAVIKLARSMGYHYSTIAAFYSINQGGIADVMKGRIDPHIAPAASLPSGFPPLSAKERKKAA